MDSKPSRHCLFVSPDEVEKLDFTSKATRADTTITITLVVKDPMNAGYIMRTLMRFGTPEKETSR
ncbi:MAG: hypothetical protein JNK56_39460 [Myxococcales bacterium]|nr:hypothetical protein [Myxococcales bacterium]